MGNQDQRIHLRSAFIGGLVAALAVMALPAVAAEVAGALQLGQSNTANTRTDLTGAAPGVNLRIVNTNPDGSPLSLVSRPGEPPLKVNRAAKVKKLNADRVDGLSAHQLVRVAHAETNNVDESIFVNDSADVLTVSVTAPRSGFLVMGSTIDGVLTKLGISDIYSCQLHVDGSLAPGTRMTAVAALSADGGSGDHEENCSTTGTRAVCPGTHTVDLRILGVDNIQLTRASLWAMYVPFDGDGKSPSLLCQLPRP